VAVRAVSDEGVVDLAALEQGPRDESPGLVSSSFESRLRAWCQTGLPDASDGPQLAWAAVHRPADADEGDLLDAVR